jgi:hypothetical protein
MEEILNSRSKHAILFGIVSASGWRFVMYLAKARNLLVGRLNSTLSTTIIFQPENLIIPSWEKF